MRRRQPLATIVLVRGGIEVASWPLRPQGPPDLALVDELARLQLTAKREGCDVRLRQPSPLLSELLHLVGLSEVLAEEGGEPGPRGLVVEVDGEAEGGEEIGIEEGVEPGDPIA
jgi:hypothetical protein